MTGMHCEKVVENMSCYLDGDGSGELRRALDDHVSGCRRCRTIFDTTRQTIEITRVTQPFEVPLGASARLYARLEPLLAED
ncbi:MAG: anti-sigma factor family protein [Candidatus Acidiferrales bacterium]